MTEAEAIATDVAITDVCRNRLKKTYIVSRHQGAIEWLNKQGYWGCVIPQWSFRNTMILNQGDVVIGTLPFPTIRDIIDLGATFIYIHLPEVFFTQRGQELTPEEMDRAGALLYYIRNLEMEIVKWR